MKKWIIAIVVLAAIGVWLALGPGLPNGGFGKSRHAIDESMLASIETKDINFAVNVAGEIGPAEQVSVRPEVNGRISELPVDIGDQVAKDQLLFALDDKDLQIEAETRQTEISRTRLQLEKAEIQLEKARRDEERDRKLFMEKLVSEQLYETSRQALDNAKADFELAKNAIERSIKDLDLVQDRLRKTRVVAPFDCTVLTRPVSVGQAVSGSGGFNSGTEVLTIANLNEMIVNAHVNQADVTRMKVGLEVQAQIEAVPGLSVGGVVERIAPQATIKNNIKGFAARISLKNVDPRVQPGMTANISIPVDSAHNVVAAPLAAVFTERNEETQTTEQFVFVRKNDQFERRLVRVGLSDINHAEVVHGLARGEVVSLVKPAEDLILRGPPIRLDGPADGAASGSQAPKTGKRPGDS